MTDEAISDDSKAMNRRILALAVPTFGQLIAEPAFVLIDTAIVGHVGDAALAGLSVGSTIVLTVVGLCVFLAYGTTSRVARLMGAGKRREGLEAGVSGLWMALIIGIVVSLVLFVFARPICAWMGAGGGVLEDAVVYLRAVSFGLPGMLLVYAANGIFRGLAKVTITLMAAVAGAVVNTILDLTFILGFGWGVFGSGIGTLIAQWFMAVVLIGPALLWARQEGASLRPRVQSMKSGMGDGLMLFVRTLALRACLMATVMLAARMGVQVLAAYQAVNSTWNFVLNMLDAIGIAGQSLVAVEIGANRPQRALHMTKAAGRAGLIAGIVIGVGMIVFGLAAPALFSTSVPVQRLIMVGMLVVGVTLPLSGWMWAIDGILIGAGDYRYLAVTCIVTACVYLPGLVGVGMLCGRSDTMSDTVRMAVLWGSVTLVFIGIRATFNGVRVRGGDWLPR